MGQFSVEDKFPFSVIILELEISAFHPRHLLFARSGCLSMCVCVCVTNSNRICLKKQKTSFIQSSHSITSLLWYTPRTTWSWIRIPPTCHKKKIYIIKYISSSTWLTFNEHWFHIENIEIPYRKYSFSSSLQMISSAITVQACFEISLLLCIVVLYEQSICVPLLKLICWNPNAPKWWNLEVGSLGGN